jgi:hypothetical protein
LGAAKEPDANKRHSHDQRGHDRCEKESPAQSYCDANPQMKDDRRQYDQHFQHFTHTDCQREKMP